MTRGRLKIWLWRGRHRRASAHRSDV